MPADERERMRSGRSLRQPFLSSIALGLVALTLVLLLLRLAT